LKRNGKFWREDFDDWKKSLKSFGRKRRRSAINIRCAFTVSTTRSFFMREHIIEDQQEHLEELERLKE